MNFARADSHFRPWARSLAVLACSALACSVIATLCLAGAAQARTSRGSSAPLKLTAAERRAITISSVSAVADPAFGVAVTVRFQGDVERYFGQGGLNAGLLAVGIAPQDTASAPAQLVDAGGGFTEQTLPVVSGRGRALRVRRSAVEQFASEHMVRTSSPGQLTLFRSGNQLVLFFTGLGLAQPASLQVKVFAKSPPAVGRPPTAFRTLTESRWQKIAVTRATGVAAISLNPAALTIPELQGLRYQLTRDLAATLTPELRAQTEARAGLRAAIDHYATLSSRLGSSRAALLAAYRASAPTITHLQREITQVQKLVVRLNSQITATANPPVGVVQTDTGLGEQMATLPGLVTSTAAPQGIPIIHVDPSVRYQRFSGIGAAMPDSSAWLIDTQLPAAQRDALMQALFGTPGTANALGVPAIHLNFLRVGIGAAGAMTVGAPYTYDDNPPAGSDPALNDFSISRDQAYIIPTVQEALQINPGLQILGSPWSPPAWMKSNDSLDNPGASGSLLTQYYQTYANYLVQFIKAYAQNGIPINAITPANEPSSGMGGTGYPGLNFPEPNEQQFITQNLAPALQAAGLQPKIYGNDLSWDSTAYADSLASGPAAGDLAGIAWHCYFGTPTAMDQIQAQAPSLDQIVSECSPEIRGFGTPEFLISSLRNWASVASVWSVALDASGGPIQTPNSCGGCRGPVTIDESSQSITFRPEYYQLGQVSAFVQPGAWRIDSEDFVSYGLNGSGVQTVSSGLDDVAFVNPDGSKVLVAYNNSGAPITFAVKSGNDYFTYTIPGHGMATFTWH